jgi:predicted  nucleic acid-binding Zn-ribbon protein
MFLIEKKSIFLSQLILISQLLFACGVNKISYCNQIMLNINQANSLVDQHKNSVDLVSTEKLVKQLDTVVKNLDKIKPGDQQLRVLITKIKQDFQKLSEGFTTMSQALEVAKKSPASVAGRQQLEKAKSQISSTTKTMNDLAKRQETLTNQLMDYCQK